MKYIATADSHDLHRAQSLLRAEGYDRVNWHWPVVLADDGKKLRGAVGTKLERGLVIAGPMVIDRTLRGRAPLVAYRLGSAYDRVMAAIGIRRYYVHVEHKLSQFQYILKRLGYEEDSDDGAGGVWFIKSAGGPWGQVRRSDHLDPVNGLKQRIGE